MAAPMYQQIAEDLQRKIKAGILKPGEQLPTEIQLRAEYNDASRNTVRDAIKRLMSLGLVETRPGSGTFVTQKIDPFITTLTQDPKSGYGGGEGATYLSQVTTAERKPTTGPIKVEVRPAPDVIAARLRITIGDPVVLRLQERMIDDIPWSTQTSYFPFGFATAAPRLLIAEDIEEGTVKYLEEVMHVKQSSYRDWITARPPDEAEQRLFSIQHDSLVFEIFRTAFDDHGEAMRMTVTVFPADRNQFIVNVGSPPDPQYETE
jgi:GntR family transcriptional regulator